MHSPYVNRGNVYAAEKNSNRAIADYTAAIAIDPKETPQL